jgi:ubiquinone biosynthesis protein Coq4
MRERYWGAWPSQAELLALPPESLGHADASWFAVARGQPLPHPVLQSSSEGDDIWLHQRVRHTHNLWHEVCGCPPTAAGEAAMSAVNVMQLRWPGSAAAAGGRFAAPLPGGSRQRTDGCGAGGGLRPGVGWGAGR